MVKELEQKEVLYQANRADTGELVQGYYFPRPNLPGGVKHYIVPLSGMPWYEVDPSTITCFEAPVKEEEETISAYWDEEEQDGCYYTFYVGDQKLMICDYRKATKLSGDDVPYFKFFGRFDDTCGYMWNESLKSHTLAEAKKELLELYLQYCEGKIKEYKEKTQKNAAIIRAVQTELSKI